MSADRTTTSPTLSEHEKIKNLYRARSLSMTFFQVAVFLSADHFVSSPLSRVSLAFFLSTRFIAVCLQFSHMPAGAHCTVNAFIIDAEFSPRCGCCCLRACLMLFRFLAVSCFATPRKILINSKALHNAPLIKLRNPASASTRGCFYHDRHDSTDRRNFCSSLSRPF